MKNLIVLIVLAGLSGCGFVFQNFDRTEHQDLTYNMTKAQVTDKIGEPQKISTMTIDDKDYEVWEYPNNDRAKMEKMRALGSIYSNVFFLDGKVVQRDKNRVYAQPAYGFTETINPGGGVKTVKNAEMTGDNR